MYPEFFLARVSGAPSNAVDPGFLANWMAINQLNSGHL